MKTTRDLVDVLISKIGYERNAVQEGYFDNGTIVLERYTDGAPGRFESITLNPTSDTFFVNILGELGEMDACELAEYYGL